MAPVKPLKTYSRPCSQLDSLFELNLKKRNAFKAKRKNVVKVRELQGTKGLLQLSDSSFHVTVNNTFDRLLKTENCQPVILKDTVRNFTSDSDLTKSRSGQPSILLSTTVQSPIIRKKRGRKRKKNDVKVQIEDVDAHKVEMLDQSVHSSLEIVKCNLSSLCRPNNITYNGSGTVNGLSFEQHSENISFDGPKICSTPMDIAPVNRYKEEKSEMGSPVSTRNKWLPRREEPAIDPKLLMVPFVSLSSGLNEQLEILGVANNVSISITENLIDHKEFHKELAVQSMTSLDESKLYVNKRRRGFRATLLPNTGEMDTTPLIEQNDCENLRDNQIYVESPLRELVVNITRLDETHRRKRGRPKTSSKIKEMNSNSRLDETHRRKRGRPKKSSKVKETNSNSEECKVAAGNDKENIKRELVVNITRLNVEKVETRLTVEDSAQHELHNKTSIMFSHSTPVKSIYRSISVKTDDISDLVSDSFTGSTTTFAADSEKTHSIPSNLSDSIESNFG